jgi:hypothetical protein
MLKINRLRLQKIIPALLPKKMRVLDRPEGRELLSWIDKNLKILKVLYLVTCGASELKTEFS